MFTTTNSAQLLPDREGDRPTDQNFLDFMQFLEHFGEIVCWRPPPEDWCPVLDPPLPKEQLSNIIGMNLSFSEYCTWELDLVCVQTMDKRACTGVCNKDSSYQAAVKSQKHSSWPEGLHHLWWSNSSIIQHHYLLYWRSGEDWSKRYIE